MWKRVLENVAGTAAEKLGLSLEAWTWRRILKDGGLLLAMLLTSSWLIRG